MHRTITVKGNGRASATPDYVIITLTFEAKRKQYEEAMSLASEQIQQIQASLCSCGFSSDALKTTRFNVNTDYERIRDRNGDYSSVFSGYVVEHTLKLSFDFNMSLLATALSAISGCHTQPELSIAFTIKDPSAINADLLESATVNARKKAEIICAASGVALGALIAINYDWGEIDIYSHTRFEFTEQEHAMIPPSGAIDITPEDITLNDSVTFVWEIS